MCKSSLCRTEARRRLEGGGTRESWLNAAQNCCAYRPTGKALHNSLPFKKGHLSLDWQDPIVGRSCFAKPFGTSRQQVAESKPARISRFLSQDVIEAVAANNCPGGQRDMADATSQ